MIPGSVLRWLALASVLATIGGAAAGGIGHFRAATDRARRTELALIEARTSAYAASADQWKMIARRRAGSAETATFRRELAATTSTLRTIAASDEGAAPVARQVSALLDRYSRTAAAEQSDLRRRDGAGRVAADSGRTDSLFGRIDGELARAVSSTEAQRAHAEKQAILAARLIVVSAAIGMLIAVALFVRARRRMLVTEIERALLRSQVDEHRFEADHDELTGLLNRRGFFTAFRAAASPHDGCVAVLLLDLDDFKEINDTFGHAAGDALLRQIGDRLHSVVRGDDRIARLGGDEFVILVDAAGTTAAAASEIARRVSLTLTAPFEIGGVLLEVRASVGVALFPDHGETADELLRHADDAMYQAKQNRTGLAVHGNVARGGPLSDLGGRGLVPQS